MWGYDESNDPTLESVFDRAVGRGINLFDTADSYGTGNGLDGREAVLLGEFLRGTGAGGGVRSKIASRVNLA